MPDISLMPLSGMNTEAEDAELHRGGRKPYHFVRDAVNVDLTPAGKAEMRSGVRRVTAQPLRNLWQSPLHGDTFATLGDQWVKVDMTTWASEPLATIGEGDTCHEVINNLVVVAGPAGLFTFNGAKAERLTIDTPPAPLVTSGSGSLMAGKYGLAVSWLRDGQESGVSELAQVDLEDATSLEVAFPMILDPAITGIRLYVTSHNGGELLRQGDYSASTPVTSIVAPPKLGTAAQFRHFSPMPTGKYMKYWRGRIVTAKANVLRFSEALAYHLHDERHAFVLMPQRITFVIPVNGGIWIGQSDHVAFLQGTKPDELIIAHKASRKPVPGSAILVDSDTLDGELAGGGSGAAMWLAENGYIVGTADGQLLELQKGVIGGVTAEQGTSVVLDRRLLTAVV